MAARQANALSHQVSGRPGHSAPSRRSPGLRPPLGMSFAPGLSCLQGVECVAAFASTGVCVRWCSEHQQGWALAFTVALSVGHACGFAGGHAGSVWRLGQVCGYRRGWLLLLGAGFSPIHSFIHSSRKPLGGVCRQAWVGLERVIDNPAQSGSCKHPWVDQSMALGILQRRWSWQPQEVQPTAARTSNQPHALCLLPAGAVQHDGDGHQL